MDGAHEFHPPLRAVGGNVSVVKVEEAAELSNGKILAKRAIEPLQMRVESWWGDVPRHGRVKPIRHVLEHTSLSIGVVRRLDPAAEPQAGLCIWGLDPASGRLDGRRLVLARTPLRSSGQSHQTACNGQKFLVPFYSAIHRVSAAKGAAGSMLSTEFPDEPPDPPALPKTASGNEKA